MDSNQAALLLRLMVVAVFVAQLGSSCSCSTSLATLERALYTTGSNKPKMNRHFFPPREESIPYASITYHFEDENGNLTDECKAVYLWAIGGFLLIQPPSVFTFSSLFFFHTRQKDFSLNLRLPHECRPLVESEGKCSCANKEDNLLDLLTQQIQLYAKYNTPRKVELGTNILTQAECYDNYDQDYLDSIKTRVFLSYVLFLPVAVLFILIVVVRTLSGTITSRLSNSLNHPNVVGLVLTGVFFHLFCLCLDVAALYFALKFKYKELPEVTARHKLNFFATAITLSFNLLVSLVLLVCSLYLQCKHVCQNPGQKWVFKHVFQRLLSPLLYVIFGEFKLQEYWNTVLSNDDDAATKKMRREHNAWIVCLMLLAPLFSLSSHVGYIFAAWLTEPPKTTSVALMYLGVFLYLFLMFRQCYVANKNLDGRGRGQNWCLPFYPLYQCCKVIANCMCACIFKRTLSEDARGYEELHGETREINADFNTRAVFVTFVWGFPLVGTVGYLVSAFYELPLASYVLPLYLLNAFQVFIVVITLLITYKVLQITEPEMRTFLKKMRDAYVGGGRDGAPQGRGGGEQGEGEVDGGNNEQDEQREQDEVEATGTIVGKMVRVVTEELGNYQQQLRQRGPGGGAGPAGLGEHLAGPGGGLGQLTGGAGGDLVEVRGGEVVSRPAARTQA